MHSWPRGSYTPARGTDNKRARVPIRDGEVVLGGDRPGSRGREGSDGEAGAERGMSEELWGTFQAEG